MQYGYRTDATTGLDLLGHRFYDPVTARFVTRDPIGDLGGLNNYEYADNNPVNEFDPSGFDSTPYGDPGNVLQDLQQSWVQNPFQSLGLANEFYGGEQAGFQNFVASTVVDFTGLGMYDPELAASLSHPNNPCGGNAQNGAMVGGVVATIVSLFTGGGEEEVVAAGAARGGVYGLFDAAGNLMRSGRTSDLISRAADHAKTYPNLVFKVLFRTDDYATQRGLEQMVHEQYDPPLNRIGGISLGNPNIGSYYDAAVRYLEGL